VTMRRIASALGCAVALSVVVGDMPAASAAAVEREVRVLATVKIPPEVRREIDTVDSVDDLARVSPAARKIIQAPAVEVIEAGKAVDPRLASGSGKAGPGCYQAWVSRKRQNVLGWVLMSSKTTVRQWCNNGTVITSQPTVQRTIRARWGYQLCGTFNTYERFFGAGRVRYGATGTAEFALTGQCDTQPKLIRNTINVYGNAMYLWRT
jgi:hypothetical protein